jgi:hypothetical protein
MTESWDFVKSSGFNDHLCNKCILLLTSAWTMVRLVLQGLREMGWGDMDWIYLAQERDQWRVLLNTLINLLIHSSMIIQPFVGPWPLLQFRNHFYADGRTPWTSDQPVARPLPKRRTTQTQNKLIHTSMPEVGFEPTIPALERAKTVHALGRPHTNRVKTSIKTWDKGDKTDVSIMTQTGMRRFS